MTTKPVAGIVPVPRMLGAFLAGGLAAVLAIPAVLGLLVDQDGRPATAVMVAVWLAMVVVSGAYLLPMSVVLGFRRDWFRYGIACLAGLELILFVVLPLSFRDGGGIDGSGSWVVALASAILALLVFGQIAKAARRFLPPERWKGTTKVAIGLLSAAAGLIARAVIAAVLDLAPLAAAVSEEGILLAAAAALAGVSLAEALDRSTRAPLVAVQGRHLIGTTVRIGVAIILALHLLWLVYVARIF